MTQPDDDDALASKSRAGDALALAKLYQRHAPGLLRYLERRLGRRDDAEDILQDAFIRIFEGRGRYQGRGQFRAWLFTIATRLAWDRAREHRRHDEILQTQYASDTSGAARQPEVALGERTLARIEAVLNDLPRDYALAFHLRVREGFSYAEIAAISGDPEGTLRSRVHHTLRRLREGLVPDGIPPDSKTRGES